MTSRLQRDCGCWHDACTTSLRLRIAENIGSQTGKTDRKHSMKPVRVLLTLIAATANLVCPRCALAADPTPPAPPTVVPQDSDDRNLQRDLRGVPDNVKTLIVTFDQTRDKYLEQQRLLLSKLRRSTTPEEQEQIRQQLQANRAQFLAELKSFRDELRTDLAALKGKINHAEFGRIIDAAHSAATEGGHRHRGQ